MKLSVDFDTFALGFLKVLLADHLEVVCRDQDVVSIDSLYLSLTFGLFTDH